MIKLEDIEQKLFEIEVKENDIRTYDMIDLMAKLHEVLDITGDTIDIEAVLLNIDKIKGIFGIEELTSSQVIYLMNSAAEEFAEVYCEINEAVGDDVKKKNFPLEQNCADSTDGNPELQED